MFGDSMFEHKKIFILGFARSGYEAAKFLIQRENEVILNDVCVEDKLDPLKVAELRSLGVQLIFGSHPDNLLDETFDYLIKNPGVPIDHKYVLKARKLGIEVVNEVEMAYRLLPSGIKIVGITGTNGKTTTTTLTYNILHDYFGEKVVLAGNIGFPLCSVLSQLHSDSILVMEVSCQQLENMSEFHPNVAVMTNLSPAHIDFLKSYENYKNVKTKLFQNQTKEDIAILNGENLDVLEQTKDILSTKKLFSSRNQVNGAYLMGNDIYYDNFKVMSRDQIFIAGLHNVENVMAAIMVAKEFDVPNENIVKTISSFKGVEHRLEYVDTVCERRFYNDTEATNIKCTQIALSSFESPIIVFLGGLERGQDFNELSSFMKNVKAIIAIGQCRERVVEFGKSMNIPTYSYEFLKDGFKKSFQVSNPNDIILLSPASASWDQYKECEVRGAEFKKLVEELKNED